jgi:hypothetical protein
MMNSIENELGCKILARSHTGVRLTPVGEELYPFLVEAEAALSRLSSEAKNLSGGESGVIRIPKAGDQVFDRYNELQKSQGYDLNKYAGKKVMRYVYQITNFPDAKEPVYATVLVYRDRIIGGDITDTTPGGRVQGFAPSKP